LNFAFMLELAKNFMITKSREKNEEMK